MAQENFNVSFPNDGLGDDLRNAFIKQQAMNTELYSSKVDKVTGQGLSENNFTNSEKIKLSGIQEGAEVNVQADWNQTDDEADDFIKNKPEINSIAVYPDTRFDYIDSTSFIVPENVQVMSVRFNGTSTQEVGVDWSQSGTTVNYLNDMEVGDFLIISGVFVIGSTLPTTLPNRTVKLVTAEAPYVIEQSDDNKFLTITTEFDPVLSLGFTANTEFWIKNTSPTPREVLFDTDIEFIGSPLIPTNGLAILKLIEVVDDVEYWSVNHLLANGTPSGGGSFKKNIFFTTTLSDLGLSTFDELTNEIVKDWIETLEIVENDNEIYYYEITDEPNYNFDLTSFTWAIEGVTDEASFIDWLANRSVSASNNLNNIVITDFSYVGNTIKCNMTADGTIYDLSNLQLQNIDKIGIVNGLQVLDLSNNIIQLFDPNIALPSTLQTLSLRSSAITTFNPTIALPIGLKYLDLSFNQITTFNPTIALPSTLEILFLNINQITTFNPTIALPIGLQSLDLSFNQITTFNPTIALPIGLQSLHLRYNQITTIGYISMEPWANALTPFLFGCSMFFQGNTNTIEGTDLQMILETKNVTILG